MGEISILNKINTWANQLAGRFNAPVYLVGSALIKENPRDVDIVVIISDIEFKNRYGCSCDDTQTLRNSCEKYWEDMAKLGSFAHRNIDENIDLKVQDESFQELCCFIEKDKFRLDTLKVPQ